MDFFNAAPPLRHSVSITNVFNTPLYYTHIRIDSKFRNNFSKLKNIITVAALHLPIFGKIFNHFSGIWELTGRHRFFSPKIEKKVRTGHQLSWRDLENNRTPDQMRQFQFSLNYSEEIKFILLFYLLLLTTDILVTKAKFLNIGAAFFAHPIKLSHSIFGEKINTSRDFFNPLFTTFICISSSLNF